MQLEKEAVIVFINGAQAPLRIEFVRSLFRSSKFQLFIVASIGLFALLQPYQPVTLQRWQAITIISAMGIVVFLCYFTGFLIGSRFFAKLKIRRLYTFWILLISALLASFLGQKSLLLFGEVPKTTAQTLQV